MPPQLGSKQLACLPRPTMHPPPSKQRPGAPLLTPPQLRVVRLVLAAGLLLPRGAVGWVCRQRHLRAAGLRGAMLWALARLSGKQAGRGGTLC